MSVSPAKRKPIWRIKDHPLSSYSSEIMMRHYLTHISEFLGSSFEELCELSLPYILEGKPIIEKGRWWSGNPATKKEEEIDIVVRTTEKELITCECEYVSGDIKPEVVHNLQKRTALISGDEKVSYIIFTKNKVTFDTTQFPLVHFYSLDDVILMLSNCSVTTCTRT